MPRRLIRGISINYEIRGDRGPVVAFTPGWRAGYGTLDDFSTRLAKRGHRVLLHDRRNCGGSDVAFDGSKSEFEVWADDLAELLEQLDMSSAVVGGISAGARLALVFALQHPELTSALLLCRPTSGRLAAPRLVERYYDQYARLAANGGMAAVCAEEWFAASIRARPSNRDRLMAMNPNEFIEVMQAWRVPFAAGCDQDIIGVSEDDLRSIDVPVCVIPGNDRTHLSGLGEVMLRHVRDCEVHRLSTPDLDVDFVPAEEWWSSAGDVDAVFADFLRRKGIGPSSDDR